MSTTVFVSGVAASGAPLYPATITLTDSASPPVVKSVATDVNGKFSCEVSGLTKPYLLAAVAGSTTLYSAAVDEGTANINPLTNLIVAKAAGSSTPTTAKGLDIGAATTAIQTGLSPLLYMFNSATANPITDVYTADNTGLDAIFDAANISVSGSSVTITANDGTQSTILPPTSLSDISSSAIISSNVPYHVNGKIVDSNAAGLQLQVQLVSAISGAVVASKTTDITGAYEFSGVPKGTYLLSSGDMRYHFVFAPIIVISNGSVILQDITAHSTT